MHLEFASEFGGVGIPFVLVEEIPRRATAAVEEVDRTPAVKGVRSVLLFGFAGEGDAVLDEGAEGSNTLRVEKGKYSVASEEKKDDEQFRDQS